MLPIVDAGMKDDLVKGLVFLWGGNGRALPVYVNHSGQSCHRSLTECSGSLNCSTEVSALVLGTAECATILENSDRCVLTLFLGRVASYMTLLRSSINLSRPRSAICFVHPTTSGKRFTIACTPRERACN